MNNTDFKNIKDYTDIINTTLIKLNENNIINDDQLNFALSLSDDIIINENMIGPKGSNDTNIEILLTGLTGPPQPYR